MKETKLKSSQIRIQVGLKIGDLIRRTLVPINLILKVQVDLRGSVHEILDRRKDSKHPVRDHLVIAMTHVVHQVDVGDIDGKGSYRAHSSECSCE